MQLRCLVGGCETGACVGLVGFGFRGQEPDQLIKTTDSHTSPDDEGHSPLAVGPGFRDHEAAVLHDPRRSVRARVYRACDSAHPLAVKLRPV